MAVTVQVLTSLRLQPLHSDTPATPCLLMQAAVVAYRGPVAAAEPPVGNPSVSMQPGQLGPVRLRISTSHSPRVSAQEARYLRHRRYHRLAPSVVVARSDVKSQDDLQIALFERDQASSAMRYHCRAKPPHESLQVAAKNHLASIAGSPYTPAREPPVPGGAASHGNSKEDLRKRVLSETRRPHATAIQSDGVPNNPCGQRHRQTLSTHRSDQPFHGPSALAN